MLKKLLSVKISLLYIILPLLICLGLFLFYRNSGNDSSENGSTPVAGSSTTGSANPCGENAVRLKGFEYIKPLVNENNGCESVRYKFLKESLNGFISEQTKAGNIIVASVYLKNLDGGDWTAVNPQFDYNPASLGKVPILITYLKKAEATPGFLDKEVMYKAGGKKIPEQYFLEDSIKLGHKYKVRELLYYMIANSDNNATELLQQNIDFASFKKTFVDLGMGEQKVVDTNYKFKVVEFSLFFEALYNAGYISPASSEYAFSLLAQCKFKDGVLKKLPANIKAVHKFGEFGYNEDKELHESAIIYLNNSPYLITIMTKGHDFRKLSEVVSQVSKMVYDYMNTSS